MRKIYLIVFGVLIVLLVGSNLVNISRCDYPVHYKLGTIDERFNISSDQFKTYIRDASNIWNKLEGKDLYVYDPNGSLTISLIFDSRQQLENQISTLENQANKQGTSLDAQVAEYERLVSEFNKKVADLNAQIADWNSKGGAPPEVYQQLKNEQKELEKEAASLNETAKSLNLKTQSYNSQVVNINTTIDTFNSTLAVNPEQGVYNGNANTIDIYFSRDKNELIHTLAHELGHALGLNHVTDPKGIMYKEATSTIVSTKDDENELINACKKRSIFQTYLSGTLFKLSFLNIIK
ncbi:MAG TPA: matrixin family metalloprotease [Patescibacteria group bacterium]